jgi:restriction endonuclease S subunit
MGSILFPKSGASVYLNHRVMMDVDGYVSSHLAVITPNELVVCPAFLLYWLYTIDSADLMQDNDYPSLKLTQISKIRVPFPPLPEQERIVKKLDAAFEKIDTIQHNAERNLANAKELFQQVLDEEMTSKAGNKLICIKDIATVLVGYAFKSSGYSTNSHDIKLVCGDNIEPGSFRWNEKTKYWPHENATQYSRFLLKTNDVVLAMDRPWIKSGLKRALVTEDILPALLLQRTACLRTTNKDVAKYIYFILGSSFFVNHVLKQQTPGSVPHISGTQIESFPLYIPDNKRIHTAVQRINLLYETTNKAERHYQELLSYCDELKQQILAKAFNGEL